MARSCTDAAIDGENQVGLQEWLANGDLRDDSGLVDVNE